MMPMPITSIDNKPKAFPEILDKLIKMRNNSSRNAWSHGSYLTTLGHHTQDALHTWDIDLLDIFCLQKLVKNGITQGHDIAKAEWECQETEEYTFGTNNVIYNSCIFAVLTMKACTKSLHDRITHEIGSEIHLLNDGAYVWDTLYNLIFPHQSTFQEVLHAKLKALTLTGHNHDFKKFSDQFATLFKPIHKDSWASRSLEDVPHAMPHAPILLVLHLRIHRRHEIFLQVQQANT